VFEQTSRHWTDSPPTNRFTTRKIYSYTGFAGNPVEIKH
jgi:hypothetical protein